MMMDQDPFVLGDDDDEDDEDEALSEMVPPPYEEVAKTETQRTETTNAEVQDDKFNEPNQHTDPTPLTYYLTPSDTLQGIALRYGVNVGNNLLLRSCKSRLIDHYF